MAAPPTIDVAGLVAVACKVRSMTVPEKTRHKTYAPEALAAIAEMFNSLHETQKIDIQLCRANYVHGTTRAFIFELPSEIADDFILTIGDDTTFETTDSLGSYTIGMPMRYTEAQQTASFSNSMWRGFLRVPAGFLHDSEQFAGQVRAQFSNAGLDVKKLAILRDKDYGIATTDYAIEFISQDVSGYVDVGYLVPLAEMQIQGRTQKVTVKFEPYKEIANHWGVCKNCLGIPRRSCTCHKGKAKLDVGGTSLHTGTRAEAKNNRREALKRKARAAAEAKKSAMRTGSA